MKVDNKHYKEIEIKIEDNVDVPFIKDDKLVGFWETVDYIQAGVEFNPEKHYWREELYVKKYAVEPNGNLIITYNSGNTNLLKWSKGCILNERVKTNSAYEIKTINNEDYLIVEWKSGDYIYGNRVAGKYVFKRIK